MLPNPYRSLRHPLRFQPRSVTDKYPWRQGLPAEWEDAIAAPLVFEIQREYEIIATRVIGRDANNLACYCKYSYALSELYCDDDDVFYEATASAVELSAWRIQDCRWLVRRIFVARDDCKGTELSYYLSEKMPS